MFFYFFILIWIVWIGYCSVDTSSKYFYDNKKIKGVLTIVILVIICVLLSWFFAYDQQNTIKKCYYNGVSVKVDTLSIDCNGVGKHIEPDSTFYINIK